MILLKSLYCLFSAIRTGSSPGIMHLGKLHFLDRQTGAFIVQGAKSSTSVFALLRVCVCSRMCVLNKYTLFVHLNNKYILHNKPVTN